MLRRVLHPWDQWGLPSRESRGFVPVMWVVRVKFWVHHAAATVECAVRTMKVWLKAPPFSHWCHWCEQRPLLPTTVLMFFHLECSGLLYNLIIQMAQWTRHIYTFSELSSINLFIIHFHRQDIFNILLFGSLFVVVKARLGDLSNFNIGWQTVPQMVFTTMHVRNGHRTPK